MDIEIFGVLGIIIITMNSMKCMAYKKRRVASSSLFRFGGFLNLFTIFIIIFLLHDNNNLPHHPEPQYSHLYRAKRQASPKIRSKWGMLVTALLSQA